MLRGRGGVTGRRQPGAKDRLVFPCRPEKVQPKMEPQFAPSQRALKTIPSGWGGGEALSRGCGLQQARLPARLPPSSHSAFRSHKEASNPVLVLIRRTPPPPPCLAAHGSSFQPLHGSRKSILAGATEQPERAGEGWGLDFWPWPPDTREDWQNPHPQGHPVTQQSGVHGHPPNQELREAPATVQKLLGCVTSPKVQASVLNKLWGSATQKAKKDQP